LKNSNCAVVLNYFVFSYVWKMIAQWLDGCSNSNKSIIIFFDAMSRLDLAPTHPPVQWVRGDYYPRGKPQECEPDHSSSQCVEVYNVQH
jgi:hypothetical protein